MSRHRLLTRESLGDVLVNLVPLAMLGAFVATFLVAGPYPRAPVETTVQLSLVAIPGVVLVVVTYYALRAVEAAERDADGDGERSPGYVDSDAATPPVADDD